MNASVKEQIDVLSKNFFFNYLGVLINTYSQILEHPREGPGKLHVPPALTSLNLSNSDLRLLGNSIKGRQPCSVPAGCPAFRCLWVAQ